MDKTKFYDFVRKALPKALERGSQVEGFEAIINEGLASRVDLRWIAYMLATAYHETAATMQPIREYGGPKYFHRMYDIQGKRPHVAHALGNTKPGDGVKFYGRGYVQLTGRTNYERYGIADTPDKALDPKVATKIMFDGMINGRFTGKKLVDYFNNRVTDWRNARKIINGLDRADLVGGYGKLFYEALEHAHKE